MKIIFFGTPQFITPVLKKLEENFDVVQNINAPRQFNDEIIEQLRSLNPDLFVVAAYGQILSAKLLEIPRLGAINIHPSLLPKYRGPSPIQSAILNGDETTGVTFIKMDDQIDHGPIIQQFEEEILPNDTFEILAKRLFEKSAEEIEEVIKQYSDNQTGIAQDESKANFTKIITKQDGYIDLLNPPGKEKIDRMIRAYFPWPSVWTHLRLSSGGQAKIIKLLPGEGIQVEGKKPMSYKDFINGYPNGKIFLQKLSLI